MIDIDASHWTERWGKRKKEKSETVTEFHSRLPTDPEHNQRADSLPKCPVLL